MDNDERELAVTCLNSIKSEIEDALKVLNWKQETRITIACVTKVEEMLCRGVLELAEYINSMRKKTGTSPDLPTDNPEWYQ